MTHSNPAKPWRMSASMARSRAVRKASRPVFRPPARRRFEPDGAWVSVTAVFVDHYVDVAQLLYEMARAKQLGDAYVASGTSSA